MGIFGNFSLKARGIYKFQILIGNGQNCGQKQPQRPAQTARKWPVQISKSQPTVTFGQTNATHNMYIHMYETETQCMRRSVHRNRVTLPAAPCPHLHLARYAEPPLQKLM
eukprot:c23943_g1_i1 orf=553-882(+)